jgi:RNA recognition motif-containing protein
MPSLYVDNLPKESFFDLDLYKFVTAKGHTLKSAKVVLDKRTNKSRGYGYLQFYTQAQADKCLEGLNNTILRDQPLRIVPSVNKMEINEKANLLVKNIEKEVT